MRLDIVPRVGTWHDRVPGGVDFSTSVFLELVPEHTRFDYAVAISSRTDMLVLGVAACSQADNTGTLLWEAP